jgi:hypothetical protein
VSRTRVGGEVRQTPPSSMAGSRNHQMTYQSVQGARQSSNQPIRQSRDQSSDSDDNTEEAQRAKPAGGRYRDPLRTGEIFKLKDVSVIKSPGVRLRVLQEQQKQAQQEVLQSVRQPSPQMLLGGQQRRFSSPMVPGIIAGTDDGCARTRQDFEDLYRNTPIPKHMTRISMAGDDYYSQLNHGAHYDSPLVSTSLDFYRANVNKMNSGSIYGSPHYQYPNLAGAQNLTPPLPRNSRIVSPSASHSNGSNSSSYSTHSDSKGIYAAPYSYLSGTNHPVRDQSRPDLFHDNLVASVNDAAAISRQQELQQYNQQNAQRGTEKSDGSKGADVNSSSRSATYEGRHGENQRGILRPATKRRLPAPQVPIDSLLALFTNPVGAQKNLSLVVVSQKENPNRTSTSQDVPRASPGPQISRSASAGASARKAAVSHSNSLLDTAGSQRESSSTRTKRVIQESESGSETDDNENNGMRPAPVLVKQPLAARSSSKSKRTRAAHSNDYVSDLSLSSSSLGAGSSSSEEDMTSASGRYMKERLDNAHLGIQRKQRGRPPKKKVASEAGMLASDPSGRLNEETVRKGVDMPLLWTAQENSALYQAHASADTKDPSFWHTVSTKMQVLGFSRVEEDCKKQWHNVSGYLY